VDSCVVDAASQVLDVACHSIREMPVVCASVLPCGCIHVLRDARVKSKRQLLQYRAASHDNRAFKLGLLFPVS